MLVILGLLTGGILAGQSLIRAAELRAVSTEYNRYVTATQTFRDKYFAVPGDMNNATSFWGKDTTNCNGHTGSAGTPGTCNGDGNAQLAWAGGAASTGESMQSWKQLALAGLVEGSYSGISTACSFCVALGTTIPSSKLGPAGWTYSGMGNVPAGNPQWFEGNYSANALFFGVVGNYTSGAALKPEEAWNIDTKMDDGRPALGKVRAWIQTFHPNCTDSTANTANYTLTQSAIACALVLNME